MLVCARWLFIVRFVFDILPLLDVYVCARHALCSYMQVNFEYACVGIREFHFENIQLHSYLGIYTIYMYIYLT